LPLYELVFSRSLDVPPFLLSLAFFARFVAVLLAGFAAFDRERARPNMRIVFAAMVYFVALDALRVHRFDPYFADLSVPYTGEAARMFAVSCGPSNCAPPSRPRRSNATAGASPCAESVWQNSVLGLLRL
jgi:hypothetical protein